MCTLAIYLRLFPRYPLVIAANRDEFLARPAAPPVTLAEDPHVVGGKDLHAGGTWLGINEYGLIAGLLNRRVDGEANPQARSRGLLCLDALRFKTVAEAREMVGGQSGRDYNPFNLLVASAREAFVAYNRCGRIETVALDAGLHLLTNIDVNDFECPRISRSYGRFLALAAREDFAADPVDRRGELARLLADHSTQLDPRTNRPNSLCLHLGDYGTRSSSLIFMDEDGRAQHYFAAGPPCTTDYEPAAVPRGFEPS